MGQLYRIIRFKSYNGSATADTLPSTKLTEGKIPLFTSEKKASEYIDSYSPRREEVMPRLIYSDEFKGKVTGRYVIDPPPKTSEPIVPSSWVRVPTFDVLCRLTQGLNYKFFDSEDVNFLIQCINECAWHTNVYYTLVPITRDGSTIEYLIRVVITEEPKEEKLPPKDLITKLVLGEIPTADEIRGELYAICNAEHASCNSRCPVFHLNGDKVPDTAHNYTINCGCDCFKSGSNMWNFIKRAYTTPQKELVK